MARSSSKSRKDWYVSARNALFICFLIPCLLQHLLAADGNGTYNNTLYFNQFVTENDALISANEQFTLCFFNYGNPPYRYFGICSTLLGYNFVWIGNRDNPGTDNSAVLTLGLDGNLAFSEGSGNRLWYTNVSTASPSTVIAVLENNGNFVLREKNSSSSHGRVLWQSFDHPSHMLLPGMKIGISLTTGKTRKLTSWKADDEPRTGSYSFGIDPQDPNQFFVLKGSVPYSRIIFWNGSDFNAILLRDEDGNGILFNTDPVVMPLRDNVTVVRSSDEVYLTISENASSWPYIDPSGILRTLAVHGSQFLVTSAWAGKLSSQRCSSPGVCGPNSSCNDNQDPICKCLPGFQPAYASKWNSGNWQDGCKLQLELHCGNGDGFLTLSRAKLPRRGSDLFYERNTCREICNEGGCNCRAYVETQRDANYSLCHFWYAEEIKNLQEDMEDEELAEETELMLRVPSSVLSQKGRRCGTCGSSIIPYPLSTGPGCGDPDYVGFHCNTSTSLLYFQTPDGSSYAISRINPETRTFVITLHGVDLCWAGSAKRMDVQLNSSQPLHLTKNNTLLLLNCSSAMKNLPHLNCSSSSPCHRYIHEGKAPCFHSKTCCSCNLEDFGSKTSHKIGVLDSRCVSYASIVNLNSSTVAIKWHEGVEIEWAAPPEPMCVSDKDCFTWPNSTCSKTNIKGVERKRCLCNKKFQWDSSTLTCKLNASRKNKQLVMIISLAVPAGIISTTALALYLLRRKMKRRVKRKKLLDMTPHHHGGSLHTSELLELANVNDNIDVPLVNFECILEATNNFSDSNRLGRGGFGPVYKGKLPGGQLIAIKRLSKSSGQGLEEFRNEVLLIAKLQHRNLVRMLGYCIEEEEKMLIYEYMPNKSLDFFLFDPNRCIFLDWNKRFNIILGITRGLLYLHQDSRLRIIHRDLKTSNILLDNDMNPKISDFGMARIFGEDQAEENTKRVVGTYGYMAPEYAADGLFSVKSDVFSYGIILLEIVSGRKNTGFYSDENDSLTGYAWRLWKEERGLNLADPSLHDSRNPTEVLRCIHLALLCIQENAVDRPTIASVLIALESEVVSLQTPKQPAFLGGTFPTTIRNSSSSSSQMPICSNNDITISALEGR